MTRKSVQGIRSEEAAVRLRQFGVNALPESTALEDVSRALNSSIAHSTRRR
jgi:hypothetical protein